LSSMHLSVRNLLLSQIRCHVVSRSREYPQICFHVLRQYESNLHSVNIHSLHILSQLVETSFYSHAVSTFTACYVVVRLTDEKQRCHVVNELFGNTTTSTTSPKYTSIIITLNSRLRYSWTEPHTHIHVVTELSYNTKSPSHFPTTLSTFHIHTQLSAFD